MQQTLEEIAYCSCSLTLGYWRKLYDSSGIRECLDDLVEVFGVRASDDAGTRCGRLENVVPTNGRNAAPYKYNRSERKQRAQLAYRIEQDHFAF
jgi:hypothetical protein